MSLLWLPTARRAPIAGQPGFAWQVNCPTKGVLHSTEGGNNVPSYTPGFKAPHLTLLVKPGVGVEPVQHIPFDRASYSLVHANGTVATNGAHAIQIEMAGTCEKGGPGYYWPGADDAVLLDVWRKLIKPLNEAFGIKLKAPPWKTYPESYGSPRDLLRLAGDTPSPLATPVHPDERTEDDPDVPDGDEGQPLTARYGASYGAGNGIRFTEAAWLAWDGWNGHEHVPGGNVHGDPGLFPWARLAAIATADTHGDDMPTPEDIAKAVWSHPVTARWNGKDEPADVMLARAEQYAIEGGYYGKRPAKDGKDGAPTRALDVAQQLAAIRQQVADLAAAVAKLQPTPPVPPAQATAPDDDTPGRHEL